METTEKNNFEIFFDLKAKTTEKIVTKKKSEEFLKFDYKANADQIDRATIRLIPWYKDPKESYVVKYTHFLTNPDDGKKVVYDSPITVKEGFAHGEITDCMVRKVWSNLFNSKNEKEKELATLFSRSKNPTRTFLVQVVSFKRCPELVGKIFLWNMPDAICQKYDKLTTKSQINPYDLFHGRELDIEVGNKNGNNSYNLSDFSDIDTSLAIPMKEVDKDGKISYEFEYDRSSGVKELVRIKKTEEDLKRALDYLKEASPDLDECRYQDPTPEKLEIVKDIIRKTVKNTALYEGIIEANKTKNVAQQTAAALPVDESEEDDEISGELADFAREVSSSSTRTTSNESMRVDDSDPYANI